MAMLQSTFLLMLGAIVASSAQIDPFAQWLREASLQLPITQTIPIKGGSMNISAVNCSGLGMQPLQTDRTVTSVTLKVSEITLDCSAKWTLELLGKDYQGSLAFQLKNDTSLKSVVKFSAGANVELSSCDPTVHLEGLQFQGLGWVVDLLIRLATPIIKKGIEAQADQLLCTVPQQILQDISSRLSNLTGPVHIPGPESPPAHLPSQEVQWSQVQLVKMLGANAKTYAQIFSRFIGAHAMDPVSGDPGTIIPDLRAHLPDFANLSVGVGPYTISGLSTVQNAALVSATVEPHSLLTRLDMGAFAGALSTKYLELAPLDNGILHAPPIVLPGMHVSFSMSNTSVVLSQVLAVSQQFLSKLELDTIRPGGVMDWSGIAKNIAAVDITRAGAEATLENVSLNLESPDSQPLLASIVKTVNTLVNSTLRTEGFPNAILNELDQFVYNTGLQYANTWLEQLLVKARNSKPPPPPTHSHHLESYWVKFIVVFSIAAVISTLAIVFRAKSTEGVKYTALGAHQSVPVQIFSVVMTVFSTACAVWGIMSPVCDVRIRVWTQLTEQDPHQMLTDSSLLVYSVPEMIHDFWASGAYVITMCLIVGTATLPSVRGLAGLGMWCIPMSPKWRGRGLLFFDLVGRMLFVNQAFISIVVATLHITLQVPGVKVEVEAEPELGLLAGTVATIAAIAHWGWVIHIHDQTEGRLRHRSMTQALWKDSTEDLLEAQVNDVQPEEVKAQTEADSVPSTERDCFWRLCSSTEGHQGQLLDKVHPSSKDARVTKQQAPSPRLSFTMLALALLSLAAYACAAASSILEFKIGGVGGIVDSVIGASKRPDGHAVVDFSLMGLGFSLPTMTAASAGASMIGTSYFLLVVAGPLLSMVSWAYIWGMTFIGKLDTFSVQKMLHVSPYLYSWCGLDVLWISIFAGALEMNLPTQWIVENQSQIINNLCDGINDTLHTPCVHIDGHLPVAGWLVLVSALLTCTIFVFTAKSFGHPALDHSEN